MKNLTLSVLGVLVCSVAFANLAPRVNLTGQVYCNTGKHPLLTSSIHIKADGTSPIHLSVDANGKFTAILPAVERIKITAEADGYERHEVIYAFHNITRDTTLDVQIYLTPQFLLSIEGNVLDAKTNLPIDAELDLFHNTDILKTDVKIIHDGKYREVVSKPGWYIIDILAPGYLSITDTLWLISEGERSIHRDYRLTPIEVGLNMVIDHVYFYFGMTELKPESASSLDKIVAFIKTNPTIVLEIDGHTDDEGAEDYNLTLSQGRAEAVVQYLVSQGIDPSRLTAKGHGEAKPIEKGITKAAKAKNRRVEFTIVKK